MMNEDDFDENGTFTFDLDNIIASKDVLAVTKMTAMEAKYEGYITVGSFLQRLSDFDLHELMEICESAKDELNDRVGELLLITGILSAAEGLDSGDLTMITQRMNSFIMLLTIESLHRKGLVRAIHSNMSLGEDAGDRVVVEKI
jgi:hypothetical protein